MGLEIDSQTAGSTARVSLRGDADMASAPELRRILDALVDGGVTEIVVDCRQLEFLDSSGIGALVATRVRLGDTGAVVIDEPRANVRKVLEVTGVDRDITLRP